MVDCLQWIILEMRQFIDSSVDLLIIGMMKSQKFIPCFKTQKSLREELLRDEFFEELMEQVDQLFTPQEHQFLTTFILQPHAHPHSRLHPPEHAPLRHRPSPAPKIEQSPLIHIREDVFRDVKRTLKRIITLAQDTPTAQERSRIAITSTAKRKVRERQHMQTMFARNQNESGTGLNERKREDTKHFKINMIRRGKYSNSKSCEKLLRDRKVLQAYDNNFLQDVLATNDSTYADQFSEQYLFQSKEKGSMYAQLQLQQLAEEDKMRSINYIQFPSPLGRSKTAIKLHRRKY